MRPSSCLDIPKQEKTYRLANGYDVYYVVYGPTDATTTFVLVHGAAGSHNDFKYLIPLLVGFNIRVIAFDVPGHGRTSAKAAGGLALTNDSIASALKEALEGMAETSTTKYIVAGQSAGGPTAIQIAAQARGVKGLVVMNSIGLRHHRCARPYFLYVLVTWMLRASTWTRFLATKFVYFFLVHLTSVFPKKTPLDAIAYSQQRMGSIDFQHLRDSVEQVKARHVPTFVANSTNDPVIETEISRELALAFVPQVTHIEFPSGGHMIQKTQAEALAEALIAWSESINSPRPKL